MSWTTKVVEELSAKGHRITSPRQTILEQVVRYTKPFSAEQLYEDVGGKDGPIGRATVYRTIELLLAEHWLARVHWSAIGGTAAEGEHSYVPIEQGHQHHLVCKQCGTVVAFEGCDIDELLGGLARRLNFRIDGHWLEAFGICQACQRLA
jgi:Fur family ferric uptake transcriptional regulator